MVELHILKSGKVDAGHGPKGKTARHGAKLLEFQHSKDKGKQSSESSRTA